MENVKADRNGDRPDDQSAFISSGRFHAQWHTKIVLWKQSI